MVIIALSIPKIHASEYTLWLIFFIADSRHLDKSSFHVVYIHQYFTPYCTYIDCEFILASHSKSCRLVFQFANFEPDPDDISLDVYSYFCVHHRLS